MLSGPLYGSARNVVNKAETTATEEKAGLTGNDNYWRGRGGGIPRKRERWHRHVVVDTASD